MGVVVVVVVVVMIVVVSVVVMVLVTVLFAGRAGCRRTCVYETGASVRGGVSQEDTGPHEQALLRVEEAE